MTFEGFSQEILIYSIFAINSINELGYHAINLIFYLFLSSDSPKNNISIVFCCFYFVYQ